LSQRGGSPNEASFGPDFRPTNLCFHRAGPSWEANDGSRVTGKAFASTPSPDPDSIPWLLINIVSHDGNGLLSRVTTVQRLNTKASSGKFVGE
jgi:hypothetical protein